jgi:hypothetical protein
VYEYEGVLDPHGPTSLVVSVQPVSVEGIDDTTPHALVVCVLSCCAWVRHRVWGACVHRMKEGKASVMKKQFRIDTHDVGFSIVELNNSV